RCADDAHRIAELTGALALVKRRQQFAPREVSRGTENDEIEWRDRNGLAAHALFPSIVVTICHRNYVQMTNHSRQVRGNSLRPLSAPGGDPADRQDRNRRAGWDVCRARRQSLPERRPDSGKAWHFALPRKARRSSSPIS